MPSVTVQNDLHALQTEVPLEIRVEGVRKSFGAIAVLRGVNLDVHRGEMIAIVGESGGGKTVLLRIMIGQIRPDQGRVWLADHELNGAPLVDLSQLSDEQMDSLRRHWAVVFQKNALFTGTVYQNIALGLSEVKGLDAGEIDRRVRSVIASVGLNPDQVLQLDRDNLSGGMAKRVAVARALALDPVLIFYDEPTTGLDPEHAGQIQDLIRDVHQRIPEMGIPRTSVIVTHDIGLLYRLRPRILVLHDGGVNFDGGYDAFVSSDSPVIRPYLELMPALHHRKI